MYCTCRQCAQVEVAYHDWIELFIVAIYIVLIGCSIAHKYVHYVASIFIPCLQVLCKLQKWTNTELYNALTVLNRDMLWAKWALKNRIMNNNSSIGVPNNHGKQVFIIYCQDSTGSIPFCAVYTRFTRSCSSSE